MPRKPVLVAAASDFHAGSTLGLCAPGPIDIQDAGVYSPSRAQLWLWDQWREFLSAVRRAAKGCRVYVVLNGDLVDGKPHGSAQVISDLGVIQRRVAAQAVAPLIDLADRLFVVRGTAAHVGQCGADEEALAEQWGAERAPDGAWSWWELPLDAAGVPLHFTHHTGGGGQPWTQGGAATRLAAATVMEYAAQQEFAPQLLVRAHVHRYQDSYGNVPGCRAIFLPAWQLRTQYGYRIAAKAADVGGMIVRCENGRYADPDVPRYKPPRTPTWRDNGTEKE